MTAVAPASSAIFACSGVTTSMMTPPFSISAKPRLTRAVPWLVLLSEVVNETCFLEVQSGVRPGRRAPDD